MLPPVANSVNGLIELLDALNCGAFLVDRFGRIEHANDRLCRMLGRERQDVIGQSAESFYDAPDAARYIQSRLANFDEPHEGEFYLPGPDKKKIPVIMSGRPLGAAAPLSNYRLVTVIDLTGQKAAEVRAQEEYEVISRLSDTVLAQALELKRYNQKLEDKVRERTRELHEANMEAIYMLAIASEAKDVDTGAHVRRIEHYTKLLARQLGLPEHVAEEYGYSAILHDVGKMVVPDHILKKPGPLDMAEREAMQLHCIAGERILSQKPFFASARQIARSHHENWDGSGYPDGLIGESIPLSARIVHLADIYDALTSERVYKASWTPQMATETIYKAGGSLFDPNVVTAFRTLSESGQFTPPETQD